MHDLRVSRGKHPHDISTGVVDHSMIAGITLSLTFLSRGGSYHVTTLLLIILRAVQLYVHEAIWLGIIVDSRLPGQYELREW